MIDPNVPSYFLIILCGFGAVWGFRRLKGNADKKLYEFEYIAFSTLWGSLIFLPILLLFERKSNLLSVVSIYPFIATPTLFVIGFTAGSLAYYINRLYSKK